jgi:hypothetical protein
MRTRPNRASAIGKTACIAVLALASVWLLCCKETRKSAASTDSWYDPPKDWTRFREARGLPDSDIAEVVAEQSATAEEQLKDIACVEIPEDRAAELTGRPMPAGEGTSLFLVRAVCLNRGTGKFMAVLAGDSLLVKHGSLGRSAVPMKRQPLVLRLPRKPETVYVSCSMAE